MKKAISLLIALAMTASLAVTALAEEDTTKTESVVTSEGAVSVVEGNLDGQEALEITSDGAEEVALETPTKETKSFSLLMQIDNPNMIVNEVSKEIDPGMGTVPVIKNERTLVPVAIIVKEMGGTVEWDDATKTATLKLNDDTIKLTIGSTTACLNDEAKELDVEPEIINDRTMLPIRFIAESFKFSVLWDGETQTIVIVKSNAVAEPEVTDEEKATDEQTETDKETVTETEETPIETETPTEEETVKE